MKLLRIRVKGFKSFGEQVSLDLPSGISCVVGPNGCGKSNLLDAIRWVLGEQKVRLLRSEKMENVIFNGGKEEKPLHMAEVSITFDNSQKVLPTEYSEVNIARRLFRAGESEYEINGTKCRLRDIRELLMGSGTTFNTYSIMELKMVDDIIYDNEKARKVLFEEAAGIGKSRVRKKETLQKLSDTAQDLLRLQDVLKEIEGNLKALETQAAQAKRYLKLKQEQKEIGLYLAWAKKKELDEKSERLLRQRQTHKQELAEQEKQRTLKETDYQKKKQAYVAQQTLVAEKQQELNQHLREIQEKENEKELQQERSKLLTRQEVQWKEQLQQYEKEESELTETQAQQRAEKKERGQLLSEQQRTLNDLEKQIQEEELRFRAVKKERESKTGHYETEKSTYHRMSRDLATHTATLESLKKQQKTLILSTEHVSEQEKTREKALHEAKQKSLLHEKQLTHLKAQDDSLRKRAQSAEAHLKALEKEAQDLSRQAHEIRHAYHWQKEAQETLSGQPEAVRFVRKNYAHFPLLSEILHCPEEYKRYLESFLSSKMNYFVSETRSAAEACLTTLAKEKIGQVWFFVLEDMEKETPEEKYKQDIPTPNVNDLGAKALLPFVQCEKKYETLCRQLLREVYLGQDLDKLSSPQEYHLIDQKKGFLYGKDGILSGGYVRQDKTALGGQKALKDMEDHLHDLERQRTEQQRRCQEARETWLKLGKEREDANIAEAYKQQYQSEARVESCRQALSQLRKQMQQSEQDQQALNESVAQKTKHLHRAKEDLAEQQSVLETLEKGIEELSALYRVEEGRWKKATQTLQAQKVQLQAHRHEVERAAERLSFTENNLSAVRNRSRELVGKQQQALSEHQALQVKQKTTGAQLTVLREEKKIREEAVKAAETLYLEERKALDKTESDLHLLRQKEQQTHLLYAEVEQALQAVKTEQQTRILFQKDLSVLEPPADFVGGREEAEKKQIQLLEQMKSMRTVNMSAAENYEALKERHDFLTSEKEDLVRADKTLRQTLSKIDKAAYERFMETFEQVRKKFRELFQHLFEKGDTCDLTLTNPDDPIDSDIHIVARPKGKKPLSIHQLSGGERALTAIALLFAAYLHKPSPFCVLDEVDAPLDDANTEKFNQMLAQLSKKSQFIVITHNKTTMEHANMLYGITMEKGLSKMVPVDLTVHH